MGRGKAASRKVQWRLPLVVTVGYLIFGIVWITISDALVLKAADTEQQMAIVQTYKGWAYVTITAAALFGALVSVITSLVRARDALEQSKIEYTQVVNSISDGLLVMDTEGRAVFINEALARMLGVEREELLKIGIGPYIRGGDHVLNEADTKLRQQGRRQNVEAELECADQHSVWTLISIDPIRDHRGIIIGELCICSDITERKRTMEALHESNEAQRRLLNELHHRMRNNLASLHSLIDLTRHSDVGLESVLSTLRGRVTAMTTAHELLAQSNWRPLPLEQILAQVIDHEVEGRVEMDGPHVLVLPDRVAPLVSVLHELMLNAKRHGSLRFQSGRLRVEWSVVDPMDGSGKQLQISWAELDGGGFEHEPEPGPGLSIVEGIVRSDLRGSIELDFAEQGATHVLTIPVNHTILIERSEMEAAVSTMPE